MYQDIKTTLKLLKDNDDDCQSPLDGNNLDLLLQLRNQVEGLFKEPQSKLIVQTGCHPDGHLSNATMSSLWMLDPLYVSVAVGLNAAYFEDMSESTVEAHLTGLLTPLANHDAVALISAEIGSEDSDDGG